MVGDLGGVVRPSRGSWLAAQCAPHAIVVGACVRWLTDSAEVHGIARQQEGDAVDEGWGKALRSATRWGPRGRRRGVKAKAPVPAEDQDRGPGREVSRKGRASVWCATIGPTAARSAANRVGIPRSCRAQNSSAVRRASADRCARMASAEAVHGRRPRGGGRRHVSSPRPCRRRGRGWARRSPPARRSG
jgi:hypothetical protein